MTRPRILLSLSDGDSRHAIAARSALEKKGYHVTMPANPESAMDAVQADRFDLVITDFMSVLERAKERHPETMAVVVFSTRNRWDPICRIIRSSPDDCLFKPFELPELEMRVHHCFKRLERLRRNRQPEGLDRRFDQENSDIANFMSHDIRSSLVSMSATLKLLSRGYYGNMDEGVSIRIKELFSNVTGIIGLTEEYLATGIWSDDDSKIEGEALNLMRDTLIPVLKEFSLELRGRHLIIDHSLRVVSSGRISLHTNRVLLKMVFRNLLKNAIKYGDARGVIALGLKEQGATYQLNVYNSGTPIPEEYREKLFTKFMRIENRDYGKGLESTSGTGLGLYLSKKVIQKLGGEIWYEAREDGSNFVFTLPAKPTFSTGVRSSVGGAQLRLLTGDTLGLEKDPNALSSL